MNNLTTPRAGDAVILTGDYSGAVPGSIGIIGGAFSGRNLSVTFDATAFRDDYHVSCSGGPASFDLPELHPTGKTMVMTYWRWKDGIAEAFNGVNFQMEVPLWEYKGSEKSKYWSDEECAVERLLADKVKLLHCAEQVMFPEGYDVGHVYRGAQPLTDIPNRPNRDYIGHKILQAYYRRKVFYLFSHEVPVGCGYRFTIQYEGSGFIAFRTEQQLNAWLCAYSLVKAPNPYGFEHTYTAILPNADIDSWQPLHHLVNAA